MWFPSLFLFLVALVGVNANTEEELQRCMDMIDPEKLELSKNIAGEEELNVLCPMITGFLNCMADLVRDQTGLELEELAAIMAGTDIGKGLTVIVNLRSLVNDLCTEGSDLREEYLQDAECYGNIDNDVIETCNEQSRAAYVAYKEFEDSIQEEAGQNERVDNEECMVAAYHTGCIAAVLHEECGEHAFETFMGIVKRLGIFRNALCSEEDIETLKTTFVDNLEMETPRRDLFRLAFDLKKRRK